MRDLVVLLKDDIVENSIRKGKYTKLYCTPSDQVADMVSQVVRLKDFNRIIFRPIWKKGQKASNIDLYIEGLNRAKLSILLEFVNEMQGIHKVTIMNQIGIKVYINYSAVCSEVTYKSEGKYSEDSGCAYAIYRVHNNSRGLWRAVAGHNVTYTVAKDMIIANNTKGLIVKRGNKIAVTGNYMFTMENYLRDRNMQYDVTYKFN